MKKTVDILGTEYTVFFENSTNPALKNNDGYCDSSVKKIVVDDFSVLPDDNKTKKENLAAQTAETLRHEIVHAFLNESGLSGCSDWATNEEMVDWIAMQGLKLYKAWQDAGAV